MCSWWALRSPGCVRECSPGGHLNKEWADSTPSAEAQLPMLFFLGREQNMVRCSGFFLRANRRVSLLQLYSRQHDVRSTICYPVTTDQSNSLKSWVLALTGCNNKSPFPSTSVCQTTEVSIAYLFLMQSQDVHRLMITVAVGQPITLSSGCCPRLCLWQLDSRLTGEHSSATMLRDFFKCVAHQNARAAPAEVSHPLLTMALLAPPVTCELGNERREGAVIYITNVRVRRTWTPLISPRLISLSDQIGDA